MTAKKVQKKTQASKTPEVQRPTVRLVFMHLDFLSDGTAVAAWLEEKKLGEDDGGDPFFQPKTLSFDANVKGAMSITSNYPGKIVEVEYTIDDNTKTMSVYIGTAVAVGRLGPEHAAKVEEWEALHITARRTLEARKAHKKHQDNPRIKEHVDALRKAGRRLGTFQKAQFIAWVTQELAKW